MIGEQLAWWYRRGHEMTPDNLCYGRGGAPVCKTCVRKHLAAMRRWRRRQTQPQQAGS